ncbi:MAG: SDR family oxidoreductase [Pseudomonadota bacterium]
MTTVLITGANRGIGLELTRQYAADGADVIACARDLGAAADLKALSDAHGNIRLETVDVDDAASVSTLKQKLGAAPIDILINNAGVMGGGAQGLADVDYDAWSHCLSVNVMGPFRMIAAFKDNVAASTRKTIVTLSSQMGSIGEASGGMTIYRSSKSAVNMVMKVLSEDLKADGVIVLPVHPGWVQTDMGGPGALLTPEESVTGLKAVIGKATLEQSGRFWRFDGEEAPW